MIASEYQRPKGTRDVVAPESWQMEAMRRLALQWAARYGYDLIDTPIFEQTPVFLRVGESTDIVQHERYRFVDAGGDDLTLRPEGTAAVARAYLQGGMATAPQPVRLCYYGPMFRRERPALGRFRQHTQFGVELYGAHDPSADAEVMLLALNIVEAAGLRDPEIRLNSIGCSACRPAYRAALVDYYRSRAAELCQDCQVRLQQNPLRLLDCKVDVAIREQAPDLASYWCDDCQDHFTAVQALLHNAGRVARRDPYLVRGLDYYTRTVFEVGHPSLGGQVALFGGGRYDGLTASLGGPSIAAVGFGMGVERLLSALPQPLPWALPARVYVAHLPGYQPLAFVWAERLRRRGLSAEADVLGRSLKAQLKDASRRASWAILVGGQEWEHGQAVVRNLGSGKQTTVAQSELEAYIETMLEHPTDDTIQEE